MAAADYPLVISSADQPDVESDRRFKLFGSHVRVLIGAPLVPGLPSPEAMGIQIEFFLRLLHRKLTRFEDGSELCALNAEPGELLFRQSDFGGRRRRRPLGGPPLGRAR